ncbi:hydrogenase expression/formation protein HypE [Tropicimonas sediminicola]|uniref:Hydrogenase maturation protein, carbamoyl dehydratase HypE n=1 Tax=Tropicimonas sediminicola TaxID=1031541 RepID=A0A239K400_9RHOB|nr:hydrogenase expression/formation protein HypE [Tropicimonas sediminicola]SNT12399.1 Hydrogenase maturation protein, carbamoyl dehydratase HypE [Tropicimonas sediminicola]
MSLTDSRISLAHGNGGRFMRELIDEVFARHLANDALDTTVDAARLALPGDRILFSTDGFTVQPLEFPGGTIGSLAVHGTTNDLAVAGGDPLFLSLNAFIEEGFEAALLERIVVDLARSAAELGVRVAAGDTKVLPRGQGGGLYLATTGIGVMRHPGALGLNEIREGDALLVSGPVGDHAVAVLLAREQFGLRGEIRSDAGSVLPLTRALRDVPGLRFMRDPTRGGLVSAAHEIARATGLEVILDEPTVPVRPPVRAVCDILGYDPYYLACEGRVVAVMAPEAADHALSAWKAAPGGADAAVIGRLQAPRNGGAVALRTELGGLRLLEELEDDPLPRIC